MASVFNLSPASIYNIMRDLSRQCDMDLRPHDARRTYAKLSRKGGASLEQVQLTLGHSSLVTTQTYIGSDLELAQGKGCGDFIQFDKESE